MFKTTPMKIIWSDIAKKNYRENLDYLINEWNYEVMKNFIEEFDNTVLLISKYPNAGQYEKKTELHKFLVVKQIYIFYEVIFEKKELRIHNVWNNKKKPFF